MLSQKQCEIARLMTQTITPDQQITQEFNNTSFDVKIQATEVIDRLAALHDQPFDQGFKTMINDFKDVATRFNISSATLFCIYMENKK